MIVVVTGTIASGKGKGADIIRDLGFEHHSFSREIRAVAKERGITCTRANLSRLGADLRKEKPDGSILGERVLDKIKKHPDRDFVLDGMRDMEEVEELEAYEKETGTKLVISVSNLTTYAMISEHRMFVHNGGPGCDRSTGAPLMASDRT